MDKPEAIAYINAMTACALIEAKGMEAENQWRAHRMESPAFTQTHFTELIEKYGIHHNAVLLLLQNS